MFQKVLQKINFQKFKKFYILLFLFFIALLFAPFLDILVNNLLQKFELPFAFVLGFLYSFSFTSGASSVMIANLENNFLIYSFFIASGSALADFTIFRIIRINFHNEVKHLFEILRLNKILSRKFKTILGFILIGSPVPDELGVMLLEEGKRFKSWQFVLLCFMANFIFVYFIARFL